MDLAVKSQSVPEPGQLVEVRRRQWIVADVSGSGLETGPSSQSLVKLTSIDEDGLGEELEVIWEIESGAHIIEKGGLPDISGVDDADKLEAFLDAVRWGAVTNADRGFLQAPYRSGVSIEDFQLDPLVRAIDRARANLLIADDVGLGKTIEAGLVIQELLLRHRARTVFIVCPASLQEKWRVEMQEKFGLEFKIVNTDYIRKLRRDRSIHANPWTSFPRLIASMDWMKTGEGLRLLREVLPVHASYPREFDILVVDEAHNVAPSGSANYVADSLRTKLIRSIAPHFQHRLFLTATPHNGYTASFTSLLELLDDQRFARTIEPDPEQLNKVMIRRLKTDLVGKDGKPLYPSRKLMPLSIEYSDEERAIHKKLGEYCDSRDRTSKGSGASGTKFINGLLKKRLFSSPAALASTLEKHYLTLTQTKKPRASSAFDDRILKKMIAKAGEEYADDSQYEQAQNDAVEEASRFSAELTQDERVLINEIRTWAQNAKDRTDSKSEAVVAWLEENLKNGAEWTDDRVILFTEYRTTHKWLHETLVASGYGGDRLEVIHGGMDQEEREVVKAAFQTNPKDSPVRILLATDAASEGIDLQNYCNYLVHLEIPYNPNVMEQRNGRIDRHGQKKSEVLIWHPVDGGDQAEDAVGGHRDDIIRSLEKLEKMREDMGSVNPVIAPQMAGLIEGERKELDTRLAEARSAKAKKFVRATRKLKERIETLHERLEQTQQDFHLTPDRICSAVKAALALMDSPAELIPVELDGAPSGTVFKMPSLSGTWSYCMEGLAHPFTKEIRPITFDHDVAKGRDDVVLVHLNHRLVQMCLRLLRAEVWAPAEKKKLNRVAIRSVANDSLTEPAVIVVSRLVITGGKHHRLHEELTLSGGYLKGGSFKREEKIGTINQWLDDSVSVDVSDSIVSGMKKRFEDSASSIEQAYLARSKVRLKNLESTLDKRKTQEVEDINRVLDELKVSIEAELNNEEQPEQLGLWSEDDRMALRRDIDSLKARLERIPNERVQETEAIEGRYEGISDRTFPVAVIFLIPEPAVGGA